MSRSPIFSEQFIDSAPAVADALQEYREDRATLLASLTASLQSDPRICAVWFHGSFGRGEADDMSDLDFWLAVSDESVAEMNAILCGHAALNESFIGGKETPQIAPLGGSFFASRHVGRQGTLGVDWSWQPLSGLTLPGKAKLLFERSEHDPILSVPSLPTVRLDKDISEEPVVGGIWFAWLMVGSAAKHLARNPQSDMALMLYPRFALEDTIIAIGQQDKLLPIDWSVPEQPLDKLERLRGLARIVAQTADAAAVQGYLFSPQYIPSLYSYLELVEGILK